jgi:hypothetical protein
VRQLSSGCELGNCPAVYEDDDRTLIVQGYSAEVSATLAPAPAGEARVRVPREVLLEAAARLAVG